MPTPTKFVKQDDELPKAPDLSAPELPNPSFEPRNGPDLAYGLSPASKARAGEILDIQGKTGLDPSFIDENYDTLVPQIKESNFDIEKYRKESPEFIKWAEENPYHAAVILPKIDKMSYVEKQLSFIKNQWDQGFDTNELSDIGFKAALGKATPEDRQRQKELEDQIQKRSTYRNYGIDSFFEQIPGFTAGMLPVVGKTIKESGITGAVGAGVGAAVGSLGGPFGTAAGLTVGARIGAFGSATKMELGQAYLEYEKLGIDRPTALGAAMTVGVVNGALETIGLNTVLSKFPVLQKFTTKGVKELLQNPTAATVFKDFAKSIGESALVEGSTEGAQSLTTSLGGALGQVISGKKNLKDFTVDDFAGALSEAWEEARAGAAAGIGLGGAGMSMRARKQYQEMITSKNTALALENAANGLRDAEVEAKSPVPKEVFDRVTNKQDVYIPAEQWNTYWQSKNVSPSEVLETIGGNANELEQAVEMGGDIAIPASSYLASIAGNENGKFFAPLLRARAGEMNVQEFEELVLEEVKAEEERIALSEEERAKRAEEDPTLLQMVAKKFSPETTGLTKEKAVASQRVVAKFISTLSAMSGLDAKDILKTYGPTVEKITRAEFDARKGMPEVTAQVAEPTVLKQDEKGAFSIATHPDNGAKQFYISIFEEGDISTVIHESAHYYLTLLKELAQVSDKKEFQDYYTSIKKEFGVEGDNFTVEVEEKFARSFEAYLREGKAPSQNLFKIFQKFAAWLTNIYEDAKELGVKLTPEIRSIFDQMLATEKEIEEVKSDLELKSLLLTDPTFYGMKPEAATKLLNVLTDTKFAVAGKVLDLAVRKIRFKYKNRFASKEGKAVFELAKEQATNEIEAEPIYQVIEAIKSGKLPSGLSKEFLLSKTTRLDESKLKQSYSTDTIEKLKAHGIVAKQGGLSPSIYATAFGFTEPDSLVLQLSQAPLKKEAIDTRIEEIVEEMFPEYRNPTKEEKIKEVEEVFHRTKTESFLRMELEHLRSEEFATYKGLSKRINKSLPSSEQVVKAAQSLVQNRNLKNLNSRGFLLVANREAKRAELLFDKGDIDGAFKAKLRELVNREALKYARQAEVKAERVLDNAEKFMATSAQKRLAQASPVYLGLVNRLLTQYGFAADGYYPVPDQTPSLSEWADQKQNGGYSVEIDALVLDRDTPKSYNEVSIKELLALGKAFKIIDKHAKDENTFRIGGEIVDRKETIGALNGHMVKVHGEKEAPEVSLLKEANYVSKFFANNIRVEFLTQIMDGKDFKLGPAFRFIFKPLIDARSAADNRLSSLIKDMDAMVNKFYSKEEIDAINSTPIDIKELTDLTKLLNRTKAPKSTVTKSTLIQMALNLGNEENEKALLEGYNWDITSLMKVLDQHLTEKDWQFVQAQLDMLESFWPEIAALEERLNGIAPEKVQAKEIVTKFGTFRGGYFPIVFNRDFSDVIVQAEEAQAANELFPAPYRTPMTKHSHTNERIGSGGKALSLLPSVFADHVNTVIHDLYFREAIINANKILTDPEFKKTFVRTFGQNLYDVFRPWLIIQARGPRNEMNHVGLEKIANGLRRNVTVVNLGLKFMSGVLQLLGTFPAVKELGASDVLKSMSAVTSPRAFREMIKFAMDNSDMMRTRYLNIDRDIRIVQQQQWFKDFLNDGKLSKVITAKDNVQALAPKLMFFTMFFDQMVSAPVWMAAYNKALGGRVSGVEAGDQAKAITYADSVIRTTQLAGTETDLPLIQSGGPYLKLFTMFLGPLNMAFNQMVSSGFDFKLTKDKKDLARAAFLIVVAPAIVEGLIRGQTPDDEDDIGGWTKWAASRSFWYASSFIPFVRDISNYAQSKIEGGKRGLSLTPVEMALEAMGSAPVALMHLNPLSDEEFTRNDLKQFVNLGGVSIGLPTGQLWKSGTYLWDWIDGAEQPDSVLEGAFRTLTVGAPKK